MKNTDTNKKGAFKAFLKEAKEMFFAQDKLLHMSACFVITTLVAAIFHKSEWCIMFGVAVAFVTGLVKEIIDMKQQNISFNAGDLWADLVGIMAACITYGITLIGG